MAETILIVDDDPVQRRLLEAMATRFGYQVVTVEGGDAAVAAVTAPDARIDCMVLDLVMPDLDGYGVLARMREAGVNVPVIVQTAHGGIDKVVSAMRAGASDFVVKPVGAERLQVSLRNALSTSALETEFQRLKRSRAGTLSFKDIVTRNARMQQVLRTAEKATASLIPVLDRRRVRRRQGADRARDPRLGRAAREAVRRGELRRDPGKSRRVDAVRPREGVVHRRDRKAHSANSSRPPAARCSSMRSANFRPPRR